LSGSHLTAELAENLKSETDLQEVHIGPPHPDEFEEARAIDIIGAAKFVSGPDRVTGLLSG
jgi:hypothetical protein